MASASTASDAGEIATAKAPWPGGAPWWWSPSEAGKHYGARSINGPIDDLLFPIQHGILFYPGYDVLPPFVVYRADRLDPDGFAQAADRLRERMRTLATTPPIPYRKQNHGDYLIPTMQLRPDLGRGAAGFALHRLDGKG